jgi:hypothetical protein
MWRNVDADTGTVHPGMVDEKSIRQKLSKQLKIDLDDDEQLHIRETPLETHDDLTDEVLDDIMSKIDTSASCRVQLKQLGTFVAKITLRGGYSVPLKFTVLKR